MAQSIIEKGGEEPAKKPVTQSTIEKSMNALSDRLVKKLPDLSQELKDAEIKINPISYVSKGLAVSTMTFIILFIAVTAIFMVRNIRRPDIVIGLSVGSALFLFFIHLITPKTRINSFAKNVERNLVFGLEALEIEIASGKPVHEAIVDIAREEYGRLSVEFAEIVEDITGKGVSFGEALRDSARRTPSIFYRKVIWQITNAIETGASLQDNLASIIEDLTKKQEFEARRYGAKLTPIVTIYMLLGVVIPALMGTFLLIASTFGGLKGIVQEKTYWSLVVVAAAIR